MLIPNSVSDSSAFEKAIFLCERFFTLFEYNSRIFTALCFMIFSNKLFNALLQFASRELLLFNQQILTRNIVLFSFSFFFFFFFVFVNSI